MLLVLICFALSAVLELGLPYLNRQFRWLIVLAGAVAISSLSVAAVYLLMAGLTLMHLLLAGVSAYRIVNIFRIVKGRMHIKYLRAVSLRTASWLIGGTVEIWLLGQFWERLRPVPSTVASCMVVLQLAVTVVAYMSLRRHGRHAEQLASTVTTKPYASAELPSITVAIAARNETETLMECLQQVVASDYPKLEILVLDDCSQGRRTSEIIRSFAQSGVRFVPGSEPANGWLARNQAYQSLLSASSGSYILFASTSLRLQPDSIRKLMTYTLQHNKSMLSALPRYDSNKARRGMFEAIRMAWEVLPPRRYIGRPPVATACWLISAEALRRSGGFSAVSRMVSPEMYFARQATMLDGYSFLPGGTFFGLTSDKPYDEQVATAIRTSYPTLHKRPELVALAILGLLWVGIGPWLILLQTVTARLSLGTGLIAALTIGFQITVYLQLLRLMYGRYRWSDVIRYPLALCTALGLLQYSMYKYEFSEVIWKGRNICLPVMHTVPRLPEFTADQAGKS